MKKAQVTPTSQINNLEVIISELGVCLEEAEEKLAVFTKLTLHVGQNMDLTVLLELEEECERQWDVEWQEFLKAQKEQEASGYKLKSMSDIVTWLWERSRSSVSQETASSVPTPMSTHVTPTLLMVVKLPDAPPTISLSPADILDHQQPLTQFGELERKEGALPTIKDFDMRDVMDLLSDLERYSLEEVVGNSADQHRAKQMEAIIALVNALSEAGIGTPSADEIMVDIPTFAAPESVQVPQHFAKKEDKIVMDSNKKFPECDSPPAIPVTPMAQE